MPSVVLYFPFVIFALGEMLSQSQMPYILINGSCYVGCFWSHSSVIKRKICIRFTNSRICLHFIRACLDCFKRLAALTIKNKKLIFPNCNKCFNCAISQILFYIGHICRGRDVTTVSNVYFSAIPASTERQWL